MKNIIPFKKDVIFKTNIEEITSISLEHNLSIEKDTVRGEFLINGEYKVSEKSTSVDPFNLQIPFEIVIDDRYDTKKATVDIDDFYYEIVNNNVLSVSIDVLVDSLEEKPIVKIDDLTEVTPVREILDADDDLFTLKDNKEEVLENSHEEIEKAEEKIDEVREEKKEEEKTEKGEERMEEKRENSNIENINEKINSLFSQISSDSDTYVEYNVYILRDGDSIDTIMEKYNITLEELKKYNDLSNLQLGDKLIIPNVYEKN